jgi:hypothetical protein
MERAVLANSGGHLPPPLSASRLLQTTKAPWWLSSWVIMVACGGVAALCAIIWLAIQGGLSYTTDPDRLAVRAYLRNNLGEPKWEEVEWWPARRWKGDGNHRICRLKYRVMTPLGRIMRDDVFWCKGAKTSQMDEAWQNAYVSQWADAFWGEPQK